MYRNLIYAGSLVPSLLLGGFQIKITQLVRRQAFDDLFFVVRNRKGHMVMYYLFAIVYCALALVVAGYALGWDKTLGNEPLSLSEETLAPEEGQQETTGGSESTLETDTRLFLMSQSQINDILLYIPAALQGILYIIHMREIESAFDDSVVAAEHHQLLPPGSSDYVGLRSSPRQYTETPISNVISDKPAQSDEEMQFKTSQRRDNDFANMKEASTATSGVPRNLEGPRESFAVNLTDMVRDFDINNRASM